MADPWLWAIVPAAIVTLLAATAACALRDYSVRDLERYGRRHGRLDRYQAILNDEDAASRGVESLKWIAASITIALASLAWLQRVDEFSNTAALLWLAAASLLTVAVGAWIPAAIADVWAEPFLFRTWPAWRAVGSAMGPVTGGTRLVAGLLRRLTGENHQPEDEEEAFEDEIRSIVNEGMHDGLLSEHAGDMIDGVIELSDSDAADIMTPRSSVDAVDVDWPWQQVLEFVVSKGRTRFPVYQGSFNNIVGILYVKDLLVELAKPPEVERLGLQALLRRAPFTLKTKKLHVLLREFLNSRNHMAIVWDEYGAVEGVVTIEDVLEEIVGEITDESDAPEEAEITPIDGATTEALGVAHLHDLNELLGIDLPDEDDYDTIGGMVTSQLGRIPRVHDSIVHDGVRITVMQADDRRVKRVRLEKLTD